MDQFKESQSLLVTETALSEEKSGANSGISDQDEYKSIAESQNFPKSPNSSMVPSEDIQKPRNHNKLCSPCALFSYIIATLILVVLLVIFIIDAVHAVKHKPQKNHTSNGYFMILASNTTYSWSILDSNDYEAIKFKFVEENMATQTVTIASTSENLQNLIPETVPYQIHGTNINLYNGRRKSDVTRYWPKGTTVNGTFKCENTGGQDVVLVWKWSNLKKEEHRAINQAIDCSTLDQHYNISCSKNEETVIHAYELLATREKGTKVITMAFCTLDENGATVTYSVNFNETRTSIRRLNYHLYNMGLHSDNPHSIKVPITTRDLQTKVYVTVDGTSKEHNPIEVHIGLILDPEIKELYNQQKMIYYTAIIHAVTVGLIAILFISFLFTSKTVTCACSVKG